MSIRRVTAERRTNEDATYQNPNGRQKPRTGVDTEPEKDKDQTDNREHCISIKNSKNDVPNESSHKVVGIDFLVGLVFGQIIHFIQKVVNNPTGNAERRIVNKRFRQNSLSKSNSLFLYLLFPLFKVVFVFIFLLFRRELSCIAERSAPQKDAPGASRD